MLPERTLPLVRRGVIDACTLGRRAVDAAPQARILLPGFGTRVVRGLRMRSTTERAAYRLCATHRRMVTTPHAPSALGGTGPRRSTPDLTKPIAEGDLLTYEVSGIAARNGVGDVDPRDTSVSVGSGPHEAGSMFDEAAELRPDRRRREDGLEGRPLSIDPFPGGSGDMWYVDNLEVGGRRGEF